MFSHKRDNISPTPLAFSNKRIQSTPLQKHLGLVLDSKLDFNQRIYDKTNRRNKTIGFMKLLSMTL